MNFLPTAKLRQQIDQEIESALEDSKQIVKESILEQPRVFTKGTLFTVKQFRDELLHRFDRDRLKVRYKTMAEVGRSLERALDNSTFVRRVSDMGIDSSFEVTKLPSELNSYDDLKAEITRMRSAMRNYKELGATLADVLGAVGSLHETTQEQERITLRLAALALYYREKIINDREIRFANNIKGLTPKELRDHATKGLDPSPEIIEEIAQDPAKRTQITEIGTLHGLLTSVAFGASGEPYGV